MPIVHAKTKDELLTMMQDSHKEFHTILSHIPDERKAEIALYDNWSIKDLIAHIGSWQKSLSERIASLRRGEQVPRFQNADEVNQMNAEFLEQHRNTPLDEVMLMEAGSFTALEREIIDATDAELFDSGHFPGYDYPIEWLIAGDTYDHYPEHLEDARAWMQQNGFD